jgi:hypothetical protein
MSSLSFFSHNHPVQQNLRRGKRKKTEEEERARRKRKKKNCLILR